MQGIVEWCCLCECRDLCSSERDKVQQTVNAVFTKLHTDISKCRRA